MFTQSATNLSYLCSLYRFHRHLYPRVHLYSYTHHPCPQHEHKQRTNERTNGRTRRESATSSSAQPPISSAFGSALCFESRAGERASEIGRGREEQAVYRAAICRESFSKQCKCSTTSPPPPPPLSALPHSLAPPSRSRDKRASMLALESENEPRNAAPTTVHRDNCSPVKRHPT